ncbi:MAG: hypothetical protein IJL69_07155, partial [Oscillospiraceae bacterium]|nr:hypothetical protein [Oscillospiraceae bacterium]
LIEHPYFGMNSLKCEWIENKWWLYRTAFSRPELSGEAFKLVFRGIDYDAAVYLNGVFLGEHRGMFAPAVFDVTELFRTSERFELLVILKGAPDEMGQIGYTSRTFTQKSRFGYKWDFGTRLVNLGLWQGVELVAEPAFVLEDVSVSSDLTGGGAGRILVSAAVRGNVPGRKPGRAEVTASLDGTVVCRRTVDVSNGLRAELAIPSPALWWPNGMGAQPLYQVSVTLDECDGFSCRQGIRSLRFLQNDGAPDGAFPYTVAVNGRRIHVCGVNLTPLDHIYGDVPAEQYRYTLRAAAAMNVNLVRVWGGGLIETETFYDLCDELGLLVWQEFIQSSSGIDNLPSRRPGFLALLEESAVAAVTQKRNHTALAVWSGGNELYEADGRPVDFRDPNIALLRAVAARLDPARLFLPTSASGPSNSVHGAPGTNHDVHGDWKYGGNPAHYALYDRADNLFHSEFGCDGLNSPDTLKKILPPEELRPTRMGESAVWRFHGDWWCTLDRDEALFGPAGDLDRAVKHSQWIQAEGLRYIVEANARRKFRNSGSIVWQFNEPWPNASVTALLEYYGSPKPAYYWVKRAYAPFHVSLRYDRLDHPAGSRFSGEVFLTANAPDAEGPARAVCEVLDVAGRILARWEAAAPVSSDRAERVLTADFTVPPVPRGLFFVRLTARSEAGRSAENLYCFSTASVRPYAAARTLDGRPVPGPARYPSADTAEYAVTNVGAEAAVNVWARERGDRFNVLCDDNFVTLFPGQTRIFRVRFSPKFRFGFDEYRGAASGGVPEMVFEAFGAPAP